MRPYDQKRNFLISVLVFCMCATVITCFSFTAVFAECFEKSAFWKLEQQEPPYVDEVNPQANTNGSCIDDISCPRPIAGKFGGAQQFYYNSATSKSGINIPPSAQADTLFDWSSKDSFSIEFWMKRDSNISITGNEVIIGRDNPKDIPDEPDVLHWWIGIRHPSGNMCAYFLGRPLKAKGIRNKYLVSRKIVNDETWHHIVFVRDAKKSENRLYVDGILEDKCFVMYTDTADYAAFASKTADLNIGWLRLSKGYHYQGELDELIIYDMALPPWYIEHRYYVDERPDDCK